MKAILFVLALLPIFAKAQLPTKDGKVIYEIVDSAKGTKDSLYRKAKFVLAGAFRNCKSVMQVEDSELGRLMGKGVLVYSYTYKKTPASGECEFSLQMDIKDGKYRLRLSDFVMRQSGFTLGIERLNDDSKMPVNKIVIDILQKDIAAFIAYIREAMNKEGGDDF